MIMYATCKQTWLLINTEQNELLEKYCMYIVNSLDTKYW